MNLEVRIVNTRKQAARFLALLIVFAVVGCSREVSEGRESQLATRLAADAPPFQREILEDGMVTSGEYESAVEAARNCVAEEGWTVSELNLAPDGYTFYFNLMWDTPDSEDEAIALEQRASETSDVCEDRYVALVERAYRFSLVPAEEERLKLMGDLGDCLESAGVNNTEVSDTEEDVVNRIVSQLSEEEFGTAFLCMDRFFFLFEEDSTG